MEFIDKIPEFIKDNIFLKYLIVILIIIQSLISVLKKSGINWKDVLKRIVSEHPEIGNILEKYL